eukprot:s955_g7.t1
MGRSDYYQGGWQKDQGGRGSRYWHGVWSPSYRKGKGDGKDTKFPRYDAKKIENPSAPSSTTALAQEPVGPPEGSLVGALQAHINAARKAEARADLQKSYQQEKDRYQKAMQKLDGDLQEAVATQDRLGAFLKQAHAASLLPEGTTDARMQATDPDWERLTRPVTQDSTHTEVEALTRLLGPDVRLWGQRLAALEGTGPPPGLEKAVHPTVPPEPSFGGKLDVPRDVHTDLGLDPFLAGKSGAPPAATEGSLDQNETSGIASPGTRPRATGSRTSVKAHTPPQFGRPDRPTLESKLEARRAALLAASRGPPDTEDREQPRPGSPRTIWRPSPPCPDRKAGARKLGSTWRSHRQVWEPGRPSALLTSERAGFSELLRNQCLCGGCVDLNSPRPFQFHLSRIVVSEILFPEVSLVRAPPTLVCLPPPVPTTSEIFSAAAPSTEFTGAATAGSYTIQTLLEECVQSSARPYFLAAMLLDTLLEHFGGAPDVTASVCYRQRPAIIQLAECLPAERAFDLTRVQLPVGCSIDDLVDL